MCGGVERRRRVGSAHNSPPSLRSWLMRSRGSPHPLLLCMGIRGGSTPFPPNYVDGIAHIRGGFQQSFGCVRCKKKRKKCCQVNSALRSLKLFCQCLWVHLMSLGCGWVSPNSRPLDRCLLGRGCKFIPLSPLGKKEDLSRVKSMFVHLTELSIREWGKRWNAPNQHQFAFT